MSRFPKRYEPVSVENEMLEFWKRENIYEKTIKLRETGPRWNFLEGPPTTNGFMHVGHARGRAMKDAQLRYMTMRGFNVWRRGGWDMQGLPVELEVEKNEGIADKGDIERNIGLENFVEKCKRLVDFYLDRWVADSVRLGLWLDYATAYQTRRDDYIEHVWHFLKIASQKGLLTRGYRVNPSCPRCVTALSGHEVSQGYKTKVDPSIYVKFRLLNRSENEYLVIWTTTPFTLLSNEMVSVHPDYIYVKVRVGTEYWWVAQSLLDTVMQKAGVTQYEIVQSLTGSDMLGWKYEHPFKEEVPWHQSHNEQYMHAVVVGTHVTLTEGTGLVHTAPGFGPDDFDMGQQYGVPVFCPVTNKGRFTDEVPLFKDRFVFDTNADVPVLLRKKGLLVHEETIEHEYPHCWRCDTPLIYLADNTQWFLKMEGVRDRLVEMNNKIEWTPEWAGTGRFGDWLANADDWCISRSRIWGSPLPVWVCTTCKNETVIGSRAELTQRAIGSAVVPELHRPWVDRVLLRCDRCGGEMRREPFVVDCWLDSGMAHTASVDYLKDPTLFRAVFPYDFITEAVDQSRGWFYSLLYTSTVMHDLYPFKACVSQGHVLDEDGGKMSKSKGNVVWMRDAFEAVGADPFRLFVLSRSAPWSSMNYSSREVQLTRKPLDILWNIVLFAETYMELDKFKYNERRMRRARRRAELEDRWLLSRLHTMLSQFHRHMGQYLYHLATQTVTDFIDNDLSRVYLPLVKKRVWLDSADPKKIMAYDVLYHVLYALVRCLNVFTPFLAEKIYRDFLMRFADGLPESINMTDMPMSEKRLYDAELEATFDVLQELRAASSHARNKRGIKLRHPVSKVILVSSSEDVRRRAESLTELLRADLNTNEFEVHASDTMAGFVRLIVRPNYKTLGPKYKSKMSVLLRGLENADAAQLRADLSQGTAKMVFEDETFEFAPEDLEFEESMPEHLSVAECKIGRVYVDVTRSRELEARGLIRDVTRRVQVMRKELDLRVDQSISLVVQLSQEEAAELARTQSDYLSGETRARSLRIAGPSDAVVWNDYTLVKEWELDDLVLRVGMTPL